ncbi:uncharacterized [Tachysurus ichikawai]
MEVEIDFREQHVTAAVDGMGSSSFSACAYSDCREVPQHEPKRKGKQAANTTKCPTSPNAGFHTAGLNQCFTEQVIVLPHYYCTTYGISCLVSSHTGPIKQKTYVSLKPQSAQHIKEFCSSECVKVSEKLHPINACPAAATDRNALKVNAPL